MINSGHETRSRIRGMRRTDKPAPFGAVTDHDLCPRRNEGTDFRLSHCRAVLPLPDHVQAVLAVKGSLRPRHAGRAIGQLLAALELLP